MHKHNTRSQDSTKNKADFSVRTTRKEVPRWKKLNCPLIPSLGLRGSGSIVRGGIMFSEHCQGAGGQNKISALPKEGYSLWKRD